MRTLNRLIQILSRWMITEEYNSARGIKIPHPQRHVRAGRIHAARTHTNTEFKRCEQRGGMGRWRASARKTLDREERAVMRQISLGWNCSHPLLVRNARMLVGWRWGHFLPHSDLRRGV